MSSCLSACLNGDGEVDEADVVAGVQPMPHGRQYKREQEREGSHSNVTYSKRRKKTRNKQGIIIIIRLLTA